MKHLFNIIDELKKAEVAFISWSDNIDLSTPTGELIFGVLAAVGQFELSLIRERTKAGLRKAQAEGKILGPADLRIGSLGVHSLETCEIPHYLKHSRNRLLSLGGVRGN